MPRKAISVDLSRFDDHFAPAVITTGELVIKLAPPPSANHLWRANHKSKRMYRSKSYSAWLTYSHLTVGRPGRFDKPVAVRLSFYGGKGFRKGRDLDNCEKAIMDFLQHCGVIEDDNYDCVPKIVKTYYPPASAKAKAYVRVAVRRIA